MLLGQTFAAYSQTQSDIGLEAAIAHHLQDGEEFDTPLTGLIAYGRKLFTAHFTREEGAGRPLTKGTGAPLSDPNSPLAFPRNNNRISGPESNSCSGCHNQPVSGGAGDLSSNVFVLGQRFDFATFDANDVVPTGGAMDERGRSVTLQSIANSRHAGDVRLRLLRNAGASDYGRSRIHSGHSTARPRSAANLEGHFVRRSGAENGWDLDYRRY